MAHINPYSISPPIKILDCKSHDGRRGALQSLKALLGCHTWLGEGSAPNPKPPTPQPLNPKPLHHETLNTTPLNHNPLPTSPLTPGIRRSTRKEFVFGSAASLTGCIAAIVSPQIPILPRRLRDCLGLWA